MVVSSVVGKVTTFGEEMKTFGTKISNSQAVPDNKMKKRKMFTTHSPQQNIYWEVGQKG